MPGFCNLYCEDPIPVYEGDVCAREKSRITAIAFIRCDIEIVDPSTADEWDAGVANGSIHIIQNVRGEKPKSSPVELDGFGTSQTETVGRDFTLTYEHPDVVDNIDFYNAMNFNNSHYIAYHTAGGRVFIADEAVVNVDADYVIPMGLNDRIIWNVEVKWSGQDLAESYVAPAGVFD